MVDFPELKGLNGGKKQQWINDHLDLIESVERNAGFEAAMEAFNMRPNTLVKALKKAGSKRRPIITPADKAMNKAIIVEEKLYELRPEVEQLTDAMLQHDQDDDQLRQTLSDFFQLQAKLNAMAAELVQKQPRNTSYFTEHISSPNRLEVDSTHNTLSLSDVKQLKDGSTSSAESADVDRPSVSKQKRTGKLTPSRSNRQRLTPQNTLAKSHFRRRRRV